jgi:hypothetical protein
MLANGGIVNSPTLAFIGERGPEAVIPLTGPNAGGGMGGNTVNINVNGGDPNAVVASPTHLYATERLNPHSS